MKGMVFVHLLEMVENEFGELLLESAIEHAQTSTQGVFTSAGTYPAEDMLKLVASLSELTQLPPSALYQHYGRYLFSKLFASYPMFPQEVLNNAFSFLASINDVIHVEVHKLYPDAELPKFITHYHDENKMILEYTSSRRMSDLALGLIEGCLQHFKEDVEIQMVPLLEDGTSVQFTLIRKP
ncbi:MAG: heme NO-binding domain-containing protein [Haliscomenobacter sp.]|uniref:heme NO-binding domain-containing protein n=1 Tax=Haliscomenobacter sp. TaxID=2717303 RepID=UPI0029AF8683|nr:heme NO-binding domain-containing protein [Haliscomenobacter sp.]MDX2068070.1 heme NO-binding domain-containing protein [Haliscomenobacter sp.]